MSIDLSSLPDELIAAIAAEVAIATAEVERKAPAPDRNSSRRLSTIDRELRTRLLVACNSALKRALEKAGAKVVSKSRVASAAPIRERIRGVETWRIPGVIGPLALKAALGLSERDLLDTEFNDLYRQWNNWVASAQDAALRTAAKMTKVPLSTVYAKANQRFNADRVAGWEALQSALNQRAIELLDQVEEGGAAATLDADSLFSMSAIRAAVAIAGGYLSAYHVKGIGADLRPVDPNQPLGGVGTGDTIGSILADQGIERNGYVWHHGLSDRPFEPHLDLDGLEFAEWDDDNLASDGFPYDEQYYYPGDHAGCTCNVEVLYSAPSGDSSGSDSGDGEQVAASGMDLAFNPDQPRGDDGKWIPTGDSERDRGGGSSRSSGAGSSRMEPGFPGQIAPTDPNRELGFDSRVGKCYELAAQYQQANPGSTLVHGSVQGFGHPPLDHAWVQTADGKVFEPTSGHVMGQDQFNGYFRPLASSSYSGSQASHEMLDSEHYGPWAAPPGPGGPTGDFEKDSARVMGILNEQQGAGRDTQNMYDRIDGKENKYTAEREAQQQAVIDHFANKAGVESDRQLLVMAGVPGAGKTTFLNSEEGQRAVGADLNKYVTVNADDVKEEMAARGMVPDYPGLTPNESIALYHEESSYIAKQVLTQALTDGKNVAYDVTLSRPGQYTDAVNLAKSLGHDYTSTVVLVDTPVATAVERAIARYEGGGRFLPTEFIKSMEDNGVSKPMASFDQIRNQVDRWAVANNRGGSLAVTVNENRQKVST